MDGGGRCVLVVAGPVVAPLPYWYDGASVWLSLPAGGVQAAALADDPRCALWMPGDPGTLAHGTARVFSLRDPLGLALHAPTLTAAVAALTLTDPAGLALGLDPAVVKVRVTVEPVHAPALPPGIAPALPMVVPPDVRRALAGRRSPVLATSGDEGVMLRPAGWGAAFVLTAAALPEGGDVVALLDADGVGLALSGTLGPGPALRPELVTWWHGTDLGSADVPPPAATVPGAITLPD